MLNRWRCASLSLFRTSLFCKMEMSSSIKDHKDEEPLNLAIVLDGVPRNGNKADGEKMLKKWGVDLANDVEKVKKIHQQGYMTVTATSEEAFQRIFEKLDGFDPGKGRKIKARRKELKREPSVELKNDTAQKRSKAAQEIRDVRDVVTPYWEKTYDQQLAIKKLELEEALKKMYLKSNKESGRKLKKWDLQALDGIVGSPVLEKYRNKVGFSCGLDQDGKVCVGFRVGRTENGITATADPTKVLFCTKEALMIRDVVQNALEGEFAKLRPYDGVDHSGFWRQVEVRSNLKAESLIVVQVHEGNCEAEEIPKIKARMKELLLNVPGVIGIGWQDNRAFSSGAEANIEYIHGDGVLEETLGDILFRIPPNAFFQTNTKGTIVLYDIVADLVAKEAAILGVGGKQVDLFDVCCGIGTIGLYIRRKIGNAIGNVVGIDIVEDSIKAANENAQINKLAEGIKFIASPAEQVMKECLENVKVEVIAVVDPPRAGLHPKVLRALRNCPLVKSIVYVSCNPNSLVSDTAPLCKLPTKRFDGGEPFVPVFMQGVDMFPHCAHIETVVLFRRGTVTDEPDKKD